MTGSAREQHLEAVYAAQLRLGGIGSGLRGAAANWADFDALMIAAIGDTPTAGPGRQAAEASLQMQEAVQDALRLADRLDDLLTDYRKAI